jgi:hypothetical protein
LAGASGWPLPQSIAANQPAQRVPEPVPERRHVFIRYTRADRQWVEPIRQVMALLLRELGRGQPLLEGLRQAQVRQRLP